MVLVAQELNKSPFFKIIIPNYNNGKYIEACLNSILKQTFQEFEIIIIDDVSDDNSVEIINKYCKSITIIIFSYFNIWKAYQNSSFLIIIITYK